MRIVPGPKGMTKQTVESLITPGALVEYEQHGKPIVGVTLEHRKNKWAVLNDRAQEVEIPPDRLFLLPSRMPIEFSTRDSKIKFLSDLSAKATNQASVDLLHDVWELLSTEEREYPTDEIVNLIAPDVDIERYLTVRRSLLGQQPYFKRGKSGFTPRSEEVVASLKEQFAVEERRAKEREILISWLGERIKSEELAPQPLEKLGELLLQRESVAALVDYAANGGKADRAKEVGELVEDLNQRWKLGLKGKGEQKAFDLLVRAKIFSAEQDLELIRRGRHISFRPEQEQEAERIAGDTSPSLRVGREDRTALRVITIDSEDTRDIDDGVSIERTGDGYRLGIHISDVAQFVTPASPLWEEAQRRGASIYTPDYKIPMLPPQLSVERCSLLPGEERFAVSFYLELDERFEVRSRSIERSTVRPVRLSYEQVDEVLYNETGGKSSARADLKEVDPQIQADLRLLWDITCALERHRILKGALQLSRRELVAVVRGGRVSLEESGDDLPARKLVAELMIAANEVAAIFGRDSSIPLLYRAQEPPDANIAEAAQTVPEGPAREYFVRGLLKRSTVNVVPAPHFGLGLEAYVQATSPIRRFTDLINHVQLITFIEKGTPHFDAAQLGSLLERVEESLEDVFLLQRNRNRYWLQRYLQQEGIRELYGTVVKVDGLKPLAELETLCMLMPFMTKSKFTPGDTTLIGRRVKLNVAKNDPRSEYLVLEESK